MLLFPLELPWSQNLCQKSAGRHPRHSEINEIISKALTACNLASRREPCGMLRTDGKRPDGMTMIPWKRGRCLVWDATVPDTLAPSHVPESAKCAGSAAQKAENIKVRKYANLTDQFLFVPIAVETLGTYGLEARKFVQELGKKLQMSTGDSLALCHLRQRISAAIQRGNSISVSGTLPKSY